MLRTQFAILRIQNFFTKHIRRRRSARADESPPPSPEVSERAIYAGAVVRSFAGALTTGAHSRSHDLTNDLTDNLTQ